MKSADCGDGGLITCGSIARDWCIFTSCEHTHHKLGVLGLYFRDDPNLHRGGFFSSWGPIPEGLDLAGTQKDMVFAGKREAHIRDDGGG